MSVTVKPAGTKPQANVSAPKKFPHVVKSATFKHAGDGRVITITHRTETHVTYVGPEPLPGWRPRKKGQKPAMRQGVVRTKPVDRFMREFGISPHAPAPRKPVAAAPAPEASPATSEPVATETESDKPTA